MSSFFFIETRMRFHTVIKLFHCGHRPGFSRINANTGLDSERRILAATVASPEVPRICQTKSGSKHLKTAGK